MASDNSVTLVGNVTRDPELRFNLLQMKFLAFCLKTFCICFGPEQGPPVRSGLSQQGNKAKTFDRILS